MSNFIRSEDEVDFAYTSGTGIFQYGAGAGTRFSFIQWEPSGLGSGYLVSIIDTVSGTAASGLWTPASGARQIYIQGSGLFLSGSTSITREEYNIIMNSGLAIMISGGAANAIRAAVGYISGQV